MNVGLVHFWTPCVVALTNRRCRIGELLERDGEQSTVTVEARLYDLRPFTNISARVAVLNSKFEGPSTSEFTFTTDEGGWYW